MAVRARLSAPREEVREWPHHYAKWTAIKASLLWSGERRMEAENYLAGGYGIRLAMEARPGGRNTFRTLAKVWQPSRLKGIQVSKDYGTPFLAATQVFDLRPAPRKFLSLDRTDNVADRMVKRGQILVTCSGSVGRATLAHLPHEKILISHDLLRVTPEDPDAWGWIYAFLRSPQGRAMMTAAQYGHIIKHLEPNHLHSLPVPVLRTDLAADFQKKAQRILDLRMEAFRLGSEAETKFVECFPSFKASKTEASTFEVKSSELFGGRRRLEASCFVPSIKRIEAAFKKHAKSVVPLSAVTSNVFVPGRFKHIYGDGGMPYLDSADILEVNPDITKFVLSLTPEEQKEYHVEPGWILIPCSGQVYGNIGHSVLATDWHVGKVHTNHLMRVAANATIRPGYLQCVLGHPELGRPRLVCFAFGSSVPEINPTDVATSAVPRLDKATEDELADLMEASAKCRDEADELEQTIGEEAEVLIDEFLAGDTTRFMAT